MRMTQKQYEWLLQLEFLLVLEHKATVEEVEAFFFDWMPKSNTYAQLNKEVCGYVPKIEDIFWNEEASTLSSQFRLKEKKFTSFFKELDAQLFHIYINKSLCLIQVCTNWGFFLEDSLFERKIVTFVSEMGKHLNYSDPRFLLAPTDQNEDYASLELKGVINTQILSTFCSMEEVIDFLEKRGIKDISKDRKTAHGYICHSMDLLM